VHFVRKNPETNPNYLYVYLDSLVASSKNLPAFIVINGDLTHHGIQSEYNAYNSFVAEIKSRYSITVFSTMGNHDCFNDGYKIFLKDLFPNSSYYGFSSSKISFYFLDTGNGTLGTLQLTDLQNKMKQDTKEKIVFTHYPTTIDKMSLSSLTNTKERAILLDLYNKTDVRFVCSAHSHQFNEHDYGNFIEVCNEDYCKHHSILLLHIDESLEKITVNYERIK
jgi:3',5'-cyclic AMP phosphodiesterase CpdA